MNSDLASKLPISCGDYFGRAAEGGAAYESLPPSLSQTDHSSPTYWSVDGRGLDTGHHPLFCLQIHRHCDISCEEFLQTVVGGCGKSLRLHNAVRTEQGRGNSPAPGCRLQTTPAGHGVARLHQFGVRAPVIAVWLRLTSFLSSPP